MFVLKRVSVLIMAPTATPDAVAEDFLASVEDVDWAELVRARIAQLRADGEAVAPLTTADLKFVEHRD